MLEMILTVALTAIFFTVVALILPQWIKSYQSFIRVSYANQIADNIIEAVKEQVTYSYDFVLKDGVSLTYQYYSKNGGVDGNGGKQEGTISFEDDAPLISGFVYDSKYYMDNKVKLNILDIVTVDKKTRLYLTITIKDNTGKEILKKDRYIRLYGIKDKATA